MSTLCHKSSSATSRLGRRWSRRYGPTSHSCPRNSRWMTDSFVLWAIVSASTYLWPDLLSTPCGTTCVVVCQMWSKCDRFRFRRIYQKHRDNYAGDSVNFLSVNNFKVSTVEFTFVLVTCLRDHDFLVCRHWDFVLSLHVHRLHLVCVDVHVWVGAIAFWYVCYPLWEVSINIIIRKRIFNVPRLILLLYLQSILNPGWPRRQP